MLFDVMARSITRVSAMLLDGPDRRQYIKYMGVRGLFAYICGRGFFRKGHRHAICNGFLWLWILEVGRF